MFLMGWLKKKLAVIYFPTTWGAKEPQNLPKSQGSEKTLYSGYVLGISPFKGLLEGVKQLGVPPFSL